MSKFQAPCERQRIKTLKEKPIDLNLSLSVAVCKNTFLLVQGIYMYNMLINNMMTNMNWLIESELKHIAMWAYLEIPKRDSR